MSSDIELFDVVALTGDLPEQGLIRGQVGTVVEVLDSDGVGVFEVEFSDDRGQTYALGSVSGHQLMVLHYHANPAA